ncbi:MAG: hypothetical protein PHW62_00785 [Candidatus Ratteibacteria bacterium]|nr:hypothetical protein [Candidatus Ratteibacteria bacterium]
MGLIDGDKINFDATNGRIREFCQEFYQVDSAGHVLRNGKPVDSTTIINDMVRKGKVTDDELVAMLK